MISCLKYFSLLLLVLGSSLCLFGQDASIEGKITDVDGLGVPGVSVYIEGQSFGTTSNAKGSYWLKGVSLGEHTLIVSSIGFYKMSQDIIVDEGDVQIRNFTMIEEVSSLSVVTIITGGSSGLKDIPGSVQYLTPRDLEKFSYTDVNRTLRAVPGVNLQEEDGFGLRPNIGLRGTGVERSSKITVMEDGVLMAPAPYAAPAAYYFPTIGRMQGVEILKGSSQIKYGPYTTGGAINLISTQIPNQLSGRLNLLGSSFGGRNLHANVGNSHGRISYLVETFQYSSDGFKKIDGGADAGFIKQDYLAKFRFSSKKEASVQQSLMLKAGQTTENSHETYLGLTEDDFEKDPFRRYAGSQKDEMTTEQSQISLTHMLDWKGWNVSTVAYRTDFSRNWYKLDSWLDSSGTKYSIASLLDDPEGNSEGFNTVTGSDFAENSELVVKANNRSYFGQGVQTAISKSFNSDKFTHKVEVGARFHMDEIDRFQWVDKYTMEEGQMQLIESGVPGTESNRVGSASAFSSYVQYKIGWKQFAFTPGLRYENITLDRLDYGKSDPDRTGIDLSERENHVQAIIPGIGLDYKLNEHLGIFAGVHKGFAPPGSKDGTKAEESINYEIGTRFYKAQLSGQAVLFFNDYSNLLGSDLAAAGGAGSGDLFNGGEVQTKGIEFQIEYDLLARNSSGFNLPISVVYTYTDAKFINDFDSDFGGWGVVESGDEFPYLAHHQFTITSGVEHTRFGANISARYMDEMRTQPGQGDIPGDQKTDAYFVLDASVNYNLSPGVSLFASMTNLTDAVYVVARRPAGLRPGMPRAITAGLKARF